MQADPGKLFPLRADGTNPAEDTPDGPYQHPERFGLTRTPAPVRTVRTTRSKARAALYGQAIQANVLMLWPNRWGAAVAIIFAAATVIAVYQARNIPIPGPESVL